ncbi:MAG: flavodoxin family protein [Planctomycetota bacterium]
MTNVLAIIGSYRKGRTIDTLVGTALDGAQAESTISVKKLYLAEKHIEYCKNCMACRNDAESESRAACVISDDMDAIYAMVEEADGYIFGTPVNMGNVTAVMKTFLERLCWVFAKPGARPLAGCPVPRSTREKAAIIIVSSGLIPPLLRRWCDDATPLIKSVCTSSLNAKVVGRLYAGAVERRGIDAYMDKAYKLGRRLAARCPQPSTGEIQR